MSSDELVIHVEGLSKRYELYENPRARLKQFVLPRLRQTLGMPSRNYFNEFWALDDVSFEVRRGETVGIIGRNGSGKSTLLQLICGTLSPTTGKVETRGRIAALLELGAGFNPDFSGRENVYMNASLMGLTREQIDERFDDIAAFADIGQFIEQPVKNYSSGMYVRLAFAVIAHVDADILIVDEALAVGDALFTQKCMRFIRKFREDHSLLFVSHDSASVVNLCDRAIWLSRGKLMSNGPAKSVCEAYLNSLLSELGSSDSQGLTAGNATQILRVGQPQLAWRDQRADFINNSNLRNDIEVFRFDENKAHDYGGGEARISNARLLDSNGAPLTWVVGGEKVTLRVEVSVEVDLEQLIVGFAFKDRLGQSLFGDNTYLTTQQAPVTAREGQTVAAEFEFFMPWLAQGDYSIQCAVAQGSQENHRQLHWVHDALVVKSHHPPVSTGLIGIPMSDIRIHAY